MTPLVAAALQITSTDDVAQNLARCQALVRQAHAAGAQFVGLPENFAFLGSDRDHRAAIAESTEDDAAGPILGAMRALARETGLWLLLGGFPERGLRPGSIRNTSLLLDPQGAVTARYRKVHLFDVDVPGGMQFRESESVDAGNDVVVAETPWGEMGLTICYDLRFPELYRQLVAQKARIITVPAAFTRETGKDHWHLLLRARAVENQAFVIAPAQFGWHGGKRYSYGHALIADPWGAVIAECGDHEGFALGRLDFAYQDRVRSSLPCLSHRKL
ncbi:MAG TPA: carbon-nitrogen hydrolase family protein [Polyangia bacterium]|jgi:predicted amidohydrolase